MRKPAQRRRFLALLAAYVVALQALLLPLSVVAGAAFDNVICTSSPADERQPAGHDNACACAAGCGMQCGVQGLAGPPPQAIAYASGAFGIVAPPVIFERAPNSTLLGPHCARAPPSA